MSVQFTVSRTDTVLVVSDSLGNNGGGVGGVPWQFGYMLALEARMGGLTVQPFGVPQTAGKAPKFWIDPQTGRKSLTLTTLGLATYLAQFPSFYTKIILQLGINDCADRAIAALTLANMVAQYTTIINAFVAKVGAANVMHCGPWAHNSGDLNTFITEFDANIPQILTSQGGWYTRFSDLPNTIGTFALADGTHPSFNGSVLLGNRTSDNTMLIT